MRALLHFHDHLDLYDGAAGERSHAEGGAGVFTGLAEDGDEQIRAAVHNGGLGFEFVGAVDEAGDFDDALHLGKFADLLFQGSQQGERGRAGGGVGCFFIDVATDFAGDDLAIGIVGQVARKKDEVAGAHGGHVVGDGRIRFRQRETEGGEFRLGCGGRFGGAEGRERDEGEEQGGGEEATHGGVTLRL